MIPVNSDFIMWTARTYAEGNMLSKVRIARMDDPQQDPGNISVIHPVVARLLYEGKARVYTVSGPSGDMSMDEPQAFSSSNISVPLKDVDGNTVITQVDDLIEVVEHFDDLVVGRVFRVVDVDAGGQWPVVRRHMVSGAARFAGWTWVDG